MAIKNKLVSNAAQNARSYKQHKIDSLMFLEKKKKNDISLNKNFTPSKRIIYQNFHISAFCCNHVISFVNAICPIYFFEQILLIFSFSAEFRI